MPFAMPEMVQETTQTTGTTTYALDGAITNYRSFADEFGATTTQTIYIVFDTQTTPSYEIGIGTWTAGIPNTLSRDQILKSTNSDVEVVWGASVKNVVGGLPGVLLGALFDPANTGLVKIATGFPSIIPVSTTGENLLNMASYSAVRAALDLEVGIDFNAYSTALNTIAGLAKTDKYFIAANGSVWQSRAITHADFPTGPGSALDADTLDGSHLSALQPKTPSFTHDFTPLSINNGGNYAHGLGAAPTLLYYYMEKIAGSPEGDWVTGDRIYSIGTDQLATGGLTVGANATHVYWALVGPQLRMITRSGGYHQDLSLGSNWKLVVNAWA